MLNKEQLIRNWLPLIWISILICWATGLGAQSAAVTHSTSVNVATVQNINNKLKMEALPKPSEQWERQIQALQAQQAEQARQAQLAQEQAANAAAQQQAQAQVVYSGSHSDWMAAAGISPADFGYVDYIVSHESGWNYLVRNNEGSGAYGLCQALPAEKMSTAGADWATNPVTQLRWCSSYASSRYGSWAGAYAAWVNQHWW